MAIQDEFNMHFNRFKTRFPDASIDDFMNFTRRKSPDLFRRFSAMDRAGLLREAGKSTIKVPNIVNVIDNMPKVSGISPALGALGRVATQAAPYLNVGGMILDNMANEQAKEESKARMAKNKQIDENLKNKPATISSTDANTPQPTSKQGLLDKAAQLGNFVFSEALTDTSFLLARKQNDAAYVPLNIWCSNREQSAFEAMRGWRKMQYDNAPQRINEHFNIYTPSRFPIVKESWKVLPQDDDLFSQAIKARELQGDLRPLSSIFDVRQGVIKGNRNLFEIDEFEYDSFDRIIKRYECSKVCLTGEEYEN